VPTTAGMAAVPSHLTANRARKTSRSQPGATSQPIEITR
jgi:hypothetical protein